MAINPLGELGGAERVLLDFIASARAVDPTVSFEVLTFAHGPLLAAAERLGAKAAVLPLPSRLHALGESRSGSNRWARSAEFSMSLARSVPSLSSFLRALRQEIVRRSPDIVHSNGMKAHLLSGITTPCSIPLVWHMHDFIGDRPFGSRVLRMTAPRVNVAIAVSDAVAHDTRRILPSIRLATILNAVDVDQFSPGPGDGPWLDHLAGMPSAPLGTLRVGLVATYARWKGQDVFLRAAAQVRKSAPDISVRFYVVGGPVYATNASQFSKAELQDLIGELEIADVAGLVPFQNDVSSVFRSLDIAVHASVRPEPFGRSIVEAMACGLPVVVAAGGGARELISDHVTGIAHQPGDAQGLYHAIYMLLVDRDLRRRLANEARIAAVARFARERLGPALIALYRSLLEEHPNSAARQ